MKNKRVRIALLLTCLVVAAGAQTAQPTVVQTNQQADLNWLMGSSGYRLVMNRGAQGTVVQKATPPRLGAGGSSVASDPNGNLLFYTDGRAVYNGADVACATCNDLNGDPAYDQPSAICPLMNGQPNIPPDRYAVFTNSAQGVSVSVVKMTNGVLEIIPKNQLIGASSGTGLITVPQPNGQDYYAIFQSALLSNVLQVTPIVVSLTPSTNNTVSFSPQTVTITGTGAPTNFTVKNFAYNNATKKLAITPSSANTPIILATVGDNAAIAFDKIVDGSDAFELSDSEFSLDGKYLYISAKTKRGVANEGGVFRYDVAAGGALTSVLGTTKIDAGYDLQLAADGNIYHIYQAGGSSNYLVGRLTGVDKSAAADVKYNLTINKNKIKIDNLGGVRFPSFLPPKNLSVSVDFDFSGTQTNPSGGETCLNAPVAFFPKTIPVADSVSWSFLEGKPQFWSPVYRFKDADNQVKMTAYYDGEKAEATKTVTLKQTNFKLKLPNDTTACSCELGKRKNNKVSPCNPAFELTVKKAENSSEPATYLWSTGIADKKTAVDSAGYYYVVAADGNNCTAYAGTVVKEYRQSYTHNSYWYFGNKAWLDFTNRKRTDLPAPPPPQTPFVNNMNAPQGCNLACDLMGNPIFYTDGKIVWDKKGNVIAADIGGTESTQVEVAQVPGDTTLFYIFTPHKVGNTVGEYEMRYSLFDLKKTHTVVGGGVEIGAIVAYNQLLFSSSTDRIFYDKDNGWLAGHEFGTATFRFYKITGGGIGQPRTSTVGTIHDANIPDGNAGQIKLNAADSVLAVAVSKALAPNPTANRVEIFHFDTSLGLASDSRSLDCGAYGQVYGVAIATGGQKVFASVRNSVGNGGIREFVIKLDAKAGGPPTPYVLPTVIKANNTNLGAMNYGPDGSLYVAMNGAASLGQITVGQAGKNNGVFQNNPSTFEPVNLPGGMVSNWGLPTWRSENKGSTNDPSVTATPNPVCAGATITFKAKRSDSMDSITWDLDNGKGGKQFPNKDTVKWTYPVPKKYYNPKLKLTNRCIQKQGCTITFSALPNNSPFVCDAATDSIILKMQIEVYPGLKPLDIPNPSNFCLSDKVTLDANKDQKNGKNEDLTFSWEPSKKTTPTYTLDAPAIIPKVTVKDKNGCKVEQANIAVNNGRPKLKPLDDVTLCQGVKTPDLDADPATSNTNTAFQWKINDADAGAMHNQPIDISASGDYTYIVRATINDADPAKRCFTLDTALVTVKSAAPENKLPTRFVICTDPKNPDPSTSRATLDAGQFATYQWKKDGAVIGEEQTVIAESAGKYQLTYAGESGCKKTATTNVVVDCIPKVVAPNAFRPTSSEEANRTFSILTYYVMDDFQVIIYNRWGQIVFESNQRDFKWNGGFKNDLDHPAPSDAYAYIVKYIGKYRAAEGTQERRGGILLIR